jgi:hypothetical protein
MAMALENVHPEILARIQKQLPEGYTVKSATAEPTRTAFLVEKDDVTQLAYMSKGNLLQVMSRKAPEVVASEGDPLGSIIQELSDTYQLHLLDKVDYNVNGALVEFAGKDQYQVSVPMLSSSTSLSGALIFTVKNKAAQPRSQERAAVDLEEQRIRLALAGKVFEVDRGIGVHGVSQEYAEMLSDFISALGFKLKLLAEDFQEAIVVSELNDGISLVAILQFSSGLVVPVRWK